MDKKLKIALNICLAGVALLVLNAPAIKHKKQAIQSYRDGCAFYEVKDYKNAIKCFNESLFFDPTNDSYLIMVGNAYFDSGQYLKALDISKKRLTFLQEKDNSDNEYISTTLRNIGILYSNLDKPIEAIPYLTQALAMDKRIYSHPHHIIALDYSNLAMPHNQLEDYEGCIALLNNELLIYKELGYKDHPDMATCYVNLGNSYLFMQNFPVALDNFKEALRIDEIFYKKNHMSIARDCNNLALTYNFLGDYESAEVYYQQALSILEQIIPSGKHPDLSLTYENCASLYKKQGNIVKAEEYLEKAENSKPKK